MEWRPISQFLQLLKSQFPFESIAQASFVQLYEV